MTVTKRFIGTFDDGSQVCIEEHQTPTGVEFEPHSVHLEAFTRPHYTAVWGRRIRLEPTQ